MKIKHITMGFKTFRERGLSGVAQVLLQKLATTPEMINGPVREIWTDYMSWLQFVNPGWLKKGNVYCFDYAIRNLPSASPIVEIGSFCGLSTNIITYLKERNEVRNPLITCDKWSFEGQELDKMLSDSRTVSHAMYRDFVKETYIRNIKMFSRDDLPYTFEMFSDEFFNAWSNCERRKDILGREFLLGSSISFCYIDGNHTYEFAKRDFENTDKYLEKRGFILFDDSADYTDLGVHKVMREVENTNRYDLLAKNPNYFFQKK